MNEPLICAICQTSRPTDTFTVRQSWRGFGVVPREALVHPQCDKKQQRELKMAQGQARSQQSP